MRRGERPEDGEHGRQEGEVQESGLERNELQFTDASKPSASVSRISQEWIEASVEKILIVEERGNLGIDVEFLEPDFVLQG